MNSTLLANLSGKSHGFVDMNVFYTQRELRKQAAIMSDKVRVSMIMCEWFCFAASLLRRYLLDRKTLTATLR